MANLERLCIDKTCGDVKKLSAGNGIRISSDAISVEPTDFMDTVGSFIETVIPANGRANVRIPLEEYLPSGYVIAAFRQMSITSTNTDRDGYKSCLIQFFGTAGGGTIANLGVYNVGDVDATVKVSVTVLAAKI